MCEKMYKITGPYNQNSIILLYLAIKYNQKITTIIVLLCVCTLISKK